MLQKLLQLPEDRGALRSALAQGHGLVTVAQPQARAEEEGEAATPRGGSRAVRAGAASRRCW